MEQIPQWLNEAVLAAGMTTVYNADDWGRMTHESAFRRSDDIAANDPSAAPH